LRAVHLPRKPNITLAPFIPTGSPATPMVNLHSPSGACKHMHYGGPICFFIRVSSISL